MIWLLFALLATTLESINISCEGKEDPSFALLQLHLICILLVRYHHILKLNAFILLVCSEKVHFIVLPNSVDFKLYSVMAIKLSCLFPIFILNWIVRIVQSEMKLFYHFRIVILELNDVVYMIALSLLLEVLFPIIPFVFLVALFPLIVLCSVL